MSDVLWKAEVTSVGHEAGEVATVVQMAMLGGLTWRRLRDAVIAQFMQVALYLVERHF